MSYFIICKPEFILNDDNRWGAELYHTIMRCFPVFDSRDLADKWLSDNRLDGYQVIECGIKKLMDDNVIVSDVAIKKAVIKKIEENENKNNSTPGGLVSYFEAKKIHDDLKRHAGIDFIDISSGKVTINPYGKN